METSVTHQKKDANWVIVGDDGRAMSIDHVQVAVLMDIRDELKLVNGTLGRIENLARCVNVGRGFVAMNKIRLHLEKHGARPKPAPKKRARK